MAKLAGLLADSKMRVLLIFGGTIAAIATGVIVSNLGGDDSFAESQKSAAAAAPKNIDVTPGNVISEKYRQLQQEENLSRAEQAQTSGKSAIPTIVGEVQTYDIDVPQFRNLSLAEQIRKAKEQKAEEKPKVQKTPSLASPRASLQLQAKRKREQERAERARTQSKQRADSQAVERMLSQMENQSKQLFGSWSNIPSQKYTEGTLIKDQQQAATANVSAGDATAGGDTTTVSAADGNVIKAGTVMFAVLDTGVNSDELSPILATIVSGRYKGSKLIGTISHAPGQEKVVLNFTRLSVPYLDASLETSAVAIDPDTARTAIATDVDHHYLLRYGTLFASSFLEGYGKAVKESGSTTVVSTNGTEASSSADLSGSEEITAAFGTVGEKWGAQLSDVFNKPPTVTVEQGTSLGILFLNDFVIPNS